MMAVREWLVVAYGDDEASHAMRLPDELRLELYPEVHEFGPAWEEVSELFELVDKALELEASTDGEPSFYPKWLAFQERFPSGGFKLPDEDFAMWDLYDLLDARTRRLGFPENSGFAWCVTFIGMVLSAKAFEPEARERFEVFTGEVEVLRLALASYVND